MFQTFNENQYYLQSELLRHGELDWLARNTYFGDQRNYLEMDIDDTFTPGRRVGHGDALDRLQRRRRDADEPV